MTIVPPKKSLPKKAGEKKKSRKRIIHVVGRPTSMFEDPEEAAAEEEVEPAAKAPPKKKKKLMADAMPKATTSKSTKSAPKKAAAADKPKRFSRDIPAASKNKTSTFREAEDDAMSALMKLRPHLPEHNASHLLAEDMKKRKDSGLRAWRAIDPYAQRRKTAMDNRSYTKEQQDFYETVLLDKSPAVSDMRYVDWKYIKVNEDFFLNVQDNFHCIGLDEFVGKEFTAWNDEMIMQFYSTAHFYGDGRIVWMTEGARYESTVDEWAAILEVPEVQDGDLDVYSESKESHDAMKDMYNAIPTAN